LKSAETALKVLREFTKLKMETQLKATRDATAARMRSELAAWNLEVNNLKKLEAQKVKCVILAPQDGMVIYANERDRRSSSSEATIQEGAAVRERQSIIKLPDLGRMQVKAKIHETKVEMLRIGMPARINVQDRIYKGKVVAVANQPEPGSWFSSSVKEYAATVAIEGEISNLKPGMTAEVEIFVADIPNALTVNVSAVVEQGGGKFYVWVVTKEGDLERRPVLVGRTNENVIEIKDGVVEGEEVVLNPRAVVEEAREEETPDESESDKNVPDGIPTGPDAGTPQGKPAGDGTPKFSDYDTDKDGKLSKEEAPERMQQSFDRADADKDGFISLSEWAAHQNRRKQAQQGGGPGGPPGAGGPGGPPGGRGPGAAAGSKTE
jgi:multidrug efflux pump subunit AcrA (membrane-fusion protein)